MVVLGASDERVPMPRRFRRARLSAHLAVEGRGLPDSRKLGAASTYQEPAVPRGRRTPELGAKRKVTPWVDENGEVTGDTCPTCEGYSQLERDLRNARTKITRLEREAERATVAKRDGNLWKETVAFWEAAFPEKRITSKGVKSARATKYFQRLEAGAKPEDVRYAITAAKTWRYVVFGKRQKSGSKSDLAIDLEHIVSVGNDAQFDRLVELGREMEAGW